ncbi:MAG: alpha-glucosidase C-terminal domain-containing protein [Planctomycetota bacterium]
MQMTFLGAPMIYYGDEAGMWGPDDPSDRMPMIWADLEPYDGQQTRVDRATLQHFQRMIAIRHAEPALRRGLFRPVMTDDAAGVLAFAREMDDRRIFVVINRSSSKRTVELPGGAAGVWIDLADDATTSVVFDKSSPTARPMVQADADAPRFTADGAGHVTVSLDPWGMAVLVPAATGAGR